MLPFARLKWPEMRPLAEELIARIHAGHAQGNFSMPVVDFVRVFSPDASEAELAKVAGRGALEFTSDASECGAFQLPEGARATFDLGREGFVLRIPVRMSGRYEVFADGFRVLFNEGEELEGCKRLFLLVCNRIITVDVTTERIYAHAHVKLLDMCVEFN
ncbi:MAG: hypothetical protein H0V88_05335 [Pyrinomonadaceae bacterium]|nr:hypothetical protein [Pyrinomonadaceae bacterium]